MIDLLVVEADIGDAAAKRLLGANEGGAKVSQFRPDASHHQVEMIRRLRIGTTQPLRPHQDVIHQQLHPGRQSKRQSKKKRKKIPGSHPAGSLPDILAPVADDDDAVEEVVVERLLGADGQHFIAGFEARLQFARSDGHRHHIALFPALFQSIIPCQIQQDRQRETQ